MVLIFFRRGGGGEFSNKFVFDFPLFQISFKLICIYLTPQAYIKLEDFDSAIEDCNLALKASTSV